MGTDGRLAKPFPFPGLVLRGQAPQRAATHVAGDGGEPDPVRRTAVRDGRPRTR